MALVVDLRSGQFSVSIEKTVNLGNFENIRIGLQESFDQSSTSRDAAYKTVCAKVNEWASQLKPEKPSVPKEMSKSPGPATQAPVNPQPVINEQDPYKDLPWRQSQKKTNLATILISDELLQNVTIADLFNKLKTVGTLRVLHTSYRLSEWNNSVYLQKWTSKPLG
jgi:hypothetical protein